MAVIPPNLVDLDKLCAPPRRIRLADKQWKVPGSPPLEWLFAFQVLQDRLTADDSDEMQALMDVRDHLVSLLAIHQPGKDTEIRRALDRLDGGAILNAVGAIYSAPADMLVQEDDAAPPPKRRAGTKSTARTSGRRTSRSSR